VAAGHEVIHQDDFFPVQARNFFPVDVKAKGVAEAIVGLELALALLASKQRSSKRLSDRNRRFLAQPCGHPKRGASPETPTSSRTLRNRDNRAC